ncbi:MAG: SPOR domain-containing protein [Ignavibacteriaceae bacterium]|nr:SPOR domain-containing protein [Ignavibacteriaceae bacterium]
MNRTELVKKVSKVYGIQPEEMKKSFETFLYKLSKNYKTGDTLTLKNFGWFHLRKTKLGNDLIDIIIFTNTANLNDSLTSALVFNVPGQPGIDFHPIDSYFSLSLNKPIIPFSDNKNNELFIPSTTSEKNRQLELKVERIMADTELLEQAADGSELLIDSEILKLNQFKLNWNDEVDDEIESAEFKFEELTWDFGNFSSETKIEPSIPGDKFNTDESKWSSDILNLDLKLNEEKKKNVNEIENKPLIESDLPISERFKVDSSPDDAGLLDFSKDLKLHENFPNEEEKYSDDLNLEVGKFVDSPKAGEIKSTEEFKWDLGENIFDSESFNEKSAGSDLNIASTVEKTSNEKIEDNKSPVALSSKEPSTKKIKEELISSIQKLREENQQRKSYWPAYLGIFVLLVGVFLIYYFVKIKNQSPESSKQITTVEIKEPLNVIERDYSFPVSYPYDKNEPVQIQEKDFNLATSSEVKLKETKTDLKSGIEVKKNEASTTVKDNEANISRGTNTLVSQVKDNIYKYTNDFVVQIAAFKSKTVAEREVEKLKKRGINAFIEKALIEGRGTWYRVRVGGFKTLNDAEKFAAQTK